LLLGREEVRVLLLPCPVLRRMSEGREGGREGEREGRKEGGVGEKGGGRD